MVNGAEALLEGVALHRLAREAINGRDEAIDDILSAIEDAPGKEFDISDVGAIISMSNVIYLLLAAINELTLNEEFTDEVANRILANFSQAVIISEV